MPLGVFMVKYLLALFFFFLSAGGRVKESKCKPGCHGQSEACPCSAFTGSQAWQAGLKDEIRHIDFSSSDKIT